MHGLLALMELPRRGSRPARARTGIRSSSPTRTGPGGTGGGSRAGRAALARADGSGAAWARTRLQAAIAECHAAAPSVEDTDWERIVLLYEALGRIAPSPVVELNRAAAVAMATGPASALRILDALTAEGSLRGYHLLPATRGELLRRLGREEEARAEFATAAALAGNDRERALLEQKARG